MSESGRRRILVIEGDPEVRHLLGVVLAGEDRDVLVVETGAAALRTLTEASPDVVVMDLTLPDVDGRTLLTRLRQDPSASAAAVVVVSSQLGPEPRGECYRLGADSFFERPFDASALVWAVRTHLARLDHQSRAALRDPLTGLLNLAGLRDAYEGMEGPRSLIMMELDGLAAMAERWGWATSELVIHEVARALARFDSDRVRPVRMGGGEFGLLLRGADPEAADSMAENVLDVVRALPIEDPDGETFRLTASIGLAVADEEIELEQLAERAQERVFRAREEGGNRAVAEDALGAATQIRIVVADDDEIASTILTHRLHKEGLEVTRYDNGVDVYEAVLREVPDIVILDVKMPGMDGFEVVERLRRTPSCADVPIILLTSMGSEADVVRGFELGADDYVLKPFSPLELVARVRRLLMRKPAAGTAR